MRSIVRNCVAALVLLIGCSALFAQVARVERASGDLRVRNGQGVLAPLVVGQAVSEGDDIVTEKGAAFLRFTDGQTVAVSENSILKIAAYKFDANQAQNSVSSFNLLRGAMRMLTGLIGTRNPASVRIVAGTATVGIRGTDFITALQAVGSGGQTATFAQVISGSVELSTAGGSLVAGAGQAVSAIGLAAPAASVTAMSGATLGQVSQLQSLNMAAGAASGATAGATQGAAGAGATSGAAGAAGATGAAVGGISTAALTTAAVVVGAGVVITSSNAVTGTTGTTAAAASAR
jgi:FecR protein